MSVIFLDRSAVHFESLGRGRPVAFLHTWAGTWRYWVPSLQLASTSHSAYALDLLGFGYSTHDSLGYSVQRQTALLGGFLDEMGIGRIALVGHGLGAWVAFSFAGIQPSRIARVMAISMPLDPISIRDTLLMAHPAELIDLLAGPDLPGSELLPDPAAIDPRALRPSLDAVELRAAFVALREAEVPCLLVYGRKDPLVHAPSVEHSLSLGPNVHQVVLADSGHFPMLDAPEEFHRLLVDFLTLEQGASPRDLRSREEWRRRLR